MMDAMMAMMNKEHGRNDEHNCTNEYDCYMLYIVCAVYVHVYNLRSKTNRMQRTSTNYLFRNRFCRRKRRSRDHGHRSCIHRIRR